MKNKKFPGEQINFYYFYLFLNFLTFDLENLESQ